MRKWVKRTLIGLGAGIPIGLLFGVGFETMMRSRASAQYAVPGKLVDIGGRKIQMDCRGIGSPTVVLQSGLDALGSLSWAAVHIAIPNLMEYSRSLTGKDFKAESVPPLDREPLYLPKSEGYAEYFSILSWALHN